MLLKYTFQRLLKKKSNILFLLILPIAFNLIFIYGMFQNNTYKIGMIDQDHSEISVEIGNYLQKKYKVLEYSSEEKAKSDLLDAKIDCFLICPSGFENSIREEAYQNITYYSIQESNVSEIAKMELEGLLKSMKLIKESCAGNDDLFHQRLQAFLEDKTAVDRMDTESMGVDVSNSVRSLGFLAMGIMFMIGTSTTIIFRDKESGVFGRIIASSMSIKQYFFDNFCCFFLVSAVQVVVVLVIISAIGAVHYGENMMAAILSSCLFIMWSISFGMLVSSFAKDMMRANAVIGFFNIVLLMLGGCLWPKEIMPPFLQRLSMIVPTGWYLSLAEKYMSSVGLKECLFEIVALTISSCVFMHIAYKKYRYK